MRAWVVVATALLCGWAGHSSSGEESTSATVFGDFEACDKAEAVKNVDSQIDRCSRALNSGLMPADPTATALIRRGNLYAFKGDYDRAKEDFDRVIALKPMARSILGNRAVVEFLQGDDVAAFKDYEAAGASSENDWHASLARGIAYRYRGDHEKAIADFNRAYRRISSEAPILVNRGFSYVAHGDYALALADFDRALKLEPDFLPREIALAKERGDPGDYNRAVPGYDHEITMIPDTFLLQRERGFALFMLGRSQEAVDALVEYQRSYPGDTVAEIISMLAAYRTYDQMLLSNIDRSKGQPWPMPILLYLRGDATREDVLAAAGTADPQRECSARFYFGEAHLTAGHRDMARTEFKRALAVCPKGAFEGVAARVELARL
jgi:tetratricopeptide (TPR) repeat protein